MPNDPVPPITDRDIQVMEIKAGVKKVIYGTAIVGVAAAFFPFAQQAATEFFQYASRERTESRVSRENSRVFLESLSEEGRSPNLDERIVLAEYYTYLSEDQEGRDRWQAFLNLLRDQREAQRLAELEAVKVATDQTSSSQDRALAATIADQLRQSADPSTTTAYTALPQSVQQLMVQLESDTTAERRKAREDLAKLGPDLVRIASLELTDPDASYRKQLGLLVALTLMMRENKSQRVAIIGMLTPPALGDLLNFAIATDRTIRIYAAEFLFDLGDPRVFPLAEEFWRKATNDDGKFNLALILKGASPHVLPADKAAARAIVQGFMGQVGPMTDQELRAASQFLG